MDHTPIRLRSDCYQVDNLDYCLVMMQAELFRSELRSALEILIQRHIDNIRPVYLKTKFISYAILF